jgi:Xaa-Pro aminopeptidase
MQDPTSTLQRWINEQGLDAFLVIQPQNRSYLSGWFNEDTEGAGLLLVGKNKRIVLANTLYKEIAEKEAKGWTVVVPPAREFAHVIAELTREYGWEKIGFESAALSYAEYEKIANAGKDTFTLHSFEKSPVEQLRRVKQPHELELLKLAISITDQTFAHICEWIQPGMTEKEVQWEILRKMVELGADGTSFESIVASGPNSSMPHAHASQRQIQAGELITIDMGARYKGYCADMTRTICLGEPAEPRAHEVYQAVLRAMKTCESGIYGGISGKDADALARNSLEDLAEYYIHGTGHGVGLQVHESPALSPRASDDEHLPTGSVVTVEPGVYIPGWGGVRIEDCVLVTEDGAEVLTKSPIGLVISRPM